MKCTLIGRKEQEHRHSMRETSDRQREHGYN